MPTKNRCLTAFAAMILLATLANAATLEENWNDFLHYTMIARLDLAKGYAQSILESSPDPVALLALSRQNPTGYQMLLDMKEKAADPNLVQASADILNLIEQGRFLERTDPKTIVEEIKRLSVSERGFLAGVKNLHNSGEYAILYMLDAMADPARKDEFTDIVRALPQVGRDAIRPLAAALQMQNTGVKAEVIKAMGAIGYPQSLPYLKYISENDPSVELRQLANASILQIDPAAASVPAANLFYMLGEEYYYHGESLAPAEDANFANLWFWDPNEKRLDRQEVDRQYFYELMCMRCCEWALKADQTFGQGIGLWLAAFFKTESTGLAMPAYFGPGHADAAVYATTAGPEYLHQALARAVKDKNTFVALGVIEALANIAGEKSLLYRVGAAQPLSQALTFDNKAVRYSAAIAIAAAGPMQDFPEKSFVVTSLVDALNEPNASADTELKNQWVDEIYPLRAVKVMLKLVTTRNPVVDLSPAIQSLIEATRSHNAELQILAGRTLAAFNNVNAQRQIAAMALAENNSLEVRVEAFNSLGESAKRNANLLEIAAIDAIYAIVSSTQADENLRNAAASAFGALNLPSQDVKRLILDQAKS